MQIRQHAVTTCLPSLRDLHMFLLQQRRIFFSVVHIFAFIVHLRNRGLH